MRGNSGARRDRTAGGRRGWTASEWCGSRPAKRRAARNERVGDPSARDVAVGFARRRSGQSPGARNRTVRSLFTPPERSFFKPAPLRAPSNPLNYRASQHPYQNGRGSVASEKVGRERRKTARNGPRGRGAWFGQLARKAAFCGFPAADRARKKNVPTGETGGGRGTVVKPSSVIGLRGSRAPSWHRLRGWSSGRGHSSVRGRRVRPPQVGVRRGPGASISEAAWSSSRASSFGHRGGFVDVTAALRPCRTLPPERNS